MRCWIVKGFLILITLCVLPINAEIFPLSIIHINDFHARFEATDTAGNPCMPSEKCVGGYARTVHTVKRLLAEQKNSVYLNAGDSFQGTLWYNVGRWQVTSQFLNMLPADAMTLGNHEFDHGIKGLVPFLDVINSPMLVANMNSRDEPTMAGKYQNSIIIKRGNRKIGIIGIILETTYNLANTGNLIFLNESDAIREETQRLRANGVNIIIVLTHCGYDVDILIAKHIGADIDIIVGGHSHTFLFTGDKQPGPEISEGNYPTEITHESGHRVLIVQAASYAKYVGNLTVYFDDDGRVVDYSGAPIYMDSTVPEDPFVVDALKSWKETVDKVGNSIVGETKVELSKSNCKSSECNLGNYFCDAMIHAFAALTPYNEQPWTNVAIGLVNSGALRVPIAKGNITYAQMITMSPFENTLTAYNISGSVLLEALEHSVKEMMLENGIPISWQFVQVSGLKIKFDITRPVSQRVVDVKVRCAACDIPKYEDLDPFKIYRIVSPDFLVNGGDGFTMLRDHSSDRQRAMTDLDALKDFNNIASPIYIGVENRITMINK